MTENKDQAEKDFSKFVMDCLLANELGDGTLYAALNDGRFVFNKSSQEWMAWQDHFWALDEMDQAHIAVEDVALSYLAEARSLVEYQQGHKGEKRIRHQDPKGAPGANIQTGQTPPIRPGSHQLPLHGPQEWRKTPGDFR